MKKRLLLLISAVVLIGSVIGGTTFALFTASTPAQRSTFHAGTLKVSLTDAGGAPLTAPFMTYTNLAPGDTVGPFQSWVKNTGSLDLVYNFSFARVGETGPANDALAAALLIKVERESGSDWVYLGEWTVQEWATNGVSAWQPTLPSQGMAHFRYTATLPLATQDPAQAGSVLVTLLVSATQPSVVGDGPATGTVSGTWTGQYRSDRANPLRSDAKVWPFVAIVAQTGNTFSGTMTEPDDPTLPPTAISGTINGTAIAGTRMMFVPINFTGTLQPNGTVVIGTRDSDPAYPFTATKQ